MTVNTTAAVSRRHFLVSPEDPRALTHLHLPTAASAWSHQPAAPLQRYLAAELRTREISHKRSCLQVFHCSDFVLNRKRAQICDGVKLGEVGCEQKNRARLRVVREELK